MFLHQKIPEEIAASEGLRYVTAYGVGFSRKRSGKNFRFFDQHDQPIRDKTVIERIKKIGIPPAYEKVWISPWANGHIQAVGLDARGRKQYRYHPKWRETRDKDKFSHILEFGKALPGIRKRVASDLAQPQMTRDKVLATIVSLLEKTLIRVGNAEYAEHNKSYGLTTLRRKHVDVAGDRIHFRFKGKSGKEWKLTLQDRRIANIVRKCSELPGYDLFKYIDEEGDLREITSSDVNAYLQNITSQDFTAKDFRTWFGTILAAIALREFQKFDTAAEAKKNVVRAVEHVASQLGNTPTICRKCYIHPEIVDAYMSGDLIKMVESEIVKKFTKDAKHMTTEEVMVLAFLQKRLKSRKGG